MQTLYIRSVSPTDRESLAESDCDIALWHDMVEKEVFPALLRAIDRIALTEQTSRLLKSRHLSLISSCPAAPYSLWYVIWLIITSRSPTLPTNTYCVI
jgi:hypothetical protein